VIKCEIVPFQKYYYLIKFIGIYSVAIIE